MFKIFPFLLFFFSISDLFNPSFGEQIFNFKKNLQTYDLGFSEKGIYVGKAYYFNKNSLEFGLNYIDTQIGEFKPLSQDSEQLKYSSNGISLAYLRYLNLPVTNSGPFLKLKLDINSLNFNTKIKISEHIYSSDNIILTCRSCPDLTISTDDSIKYIPSFLLGWSHSFDNDILLNLGVGVQYLNINKIDWKLSDNSLLPAFANEKINQILYDYENTFLDKYKILPLLEFKIAYRF